MFFLSCGQSAQEKFLSRTTVNQGGHNGPLIYYYTGKSYFNFRGIMASGPITLKLKDSVIKRLTFSFALLW